MNTGHIYKLKYLTERYDLLLSKKPKNTNNDPELVEKLNY